jgi:hypothetical protein
LAEDKNLSYLIAGDGEDKWRLERKAVSLGIDKHVVFAPPVALDQAIIPVLNSATLQFDETGAGRRNMSRRCGASCNIQTRMIS